MFLLSKSNNTIWMFYCKTVGEWENSVNIPYIYKVEIVARVTLIIGSVLDLFFQSDFVILFSIQEFILLSSAKQYIQVINILEEIKDTKGVIRSRKSKKNRQHHGQKKSLKIPKG